MGPINNLAEQTSIALQYESGVKILGNTEFKAEWANAAVNLADFYRFCSSELYSSRIDRSLQLYEQTYKYFNDVEDTNSQWHAFQGLIEIYIERATTVEPLAFEKGIALCQELLEYDFVATDKSKETTILYLLGDAYRIRMLGTREQNLTLSLAYLSSALEHAQVHSDLSLWSKIRIALADILIGNPKFSQSGDAIFDAKKYLQDIIQRPEIIKYPQQFLSAKTLFAKCLSIQSEQGAFEGLKQLKDISEGLSEEDSCIFAAAAFFRWGETALTSYRLYKNWEFLKDAENAFKMANRLSDKKLQPESYIKTLGYLARVYEIQERWIDAHHLFEKAMSFFNLEIERNDDSLLIQQLTYSINYLFDNSPFVAAAVNDVAAALTWYEFLNARKLKDVLSSESFEGALGHAKLKNLQILGEGALGFAHGRERSKLTDGLQAIKKIGKPAQNGSYSFKNKSENFSSDVVWHVLPLFGENHSRVVLIPPRSSISGAILSPIEPIGRNQLSAFFVGEKNQSRQGYGLAFCRFEENRELGDFSNSIEGAVDFVNRLFGGWLKSVLKLRNAKSSDQIVLSSNSILNMFPITAVCNSFAENQMNFECQSVSVVPSPATFQKIAQRLEDEKNDIEFTHHKLAFFAGKKERLPTVELEQALVLAAFGQANSEENKCVFSEKSAALNIPNNPTHLHFGTHGIFNTMSPMYSSLELSDGTGLMLYELFGANTMKDLRLVFLSSCFVGQFETIDTFAEFNGFPSVFLQLGAKGVIANIWPVSEQAATLLTTRFYDEHISSNKQPALALAKAQEWLAKSTSKELVFFLNDKIRNIGFPHKYAQRIINDLEFGHADNRPFAHPFFWSGYVLYGN